MCGDLEARRMRKEYLAIARGAPAADHWHCAGPIGDLVESEIRIKKWVVTGGLSAATGFQVLGRAGDSCLLKAKPVTGRTNQIRIHAAYAGHVLYGDKLYHPDEAVFLEYFASGQTANVTARTGFSRLCLHATAMEFAHPETGSACRVESALPEDLKGLWASLGGC
jgi:23S rRNA-/tRNA-specific pseudouridylate synthase